MVYATEEGAMGKSQPTYTKEFKQQAVKLFETSGKTKTQIARDLGISDSSATVNGVKSLENLEKRLFQEKVTNLDRRGK
jgi:transposase-like protein